MRNRKKSLLQIRVEPVIKEFIIDLCVDFQQPISEMGRIIIHEGLANRKGLSEKLEQKRNQEKISQESERIDREMSWAVKKATSYGRAIQLIEQLNQNTYASIDPDLSELLLKRMTLFFGKDSPQYKHIHTLTKKPTRRK
tara:strand:- start:1602 stop:2021 length:420 start_codon:yes stop_codon:yes gene_type:complete